MLRVTPEPICEWVGLSLACGLNGQRWQKPPGRPPKLIKPQKQELAMLIEKGLVQSSIAFVCSRSPSIQKLTCERFEGSCNTSYIAQSRKPLGFSYQKVSWASYRLNEEERHAWYTTSWPWNLTVAKWQKREGPYCCLVMRLRSRSERPSRTAGRGKATTKRG